MHMEYSLVVGRFQCLPPHEGHLKLIRSLLDKGKNVCVALREEDGSNKNPFTYKEREAAFKSIFSKEIDKGKMVIMSIPDITDVNFGRGVGYKVFRFDTAIENISASVIRKKVDVSLPSHQLLKKKWHWRKIKTGLLVRSAIIYRISVICIQTLFFWVWTGELKLAIGTSLAWNVINMTWYWTYHYTFAKSFKLGRDNEK